MSHAYTLSYRAYRYQSLAWLRSDRGATEGSDGDTAVHKRISTRARAQQDNRCMHAWGGVALVLATAGLMILHTWRYRT